MLKKPSNYDEIQVNQDFERLELGGHKGIIKKVEEYTSPISNNTSLKVEVDTASDDSQPNYYQKQYDENTNANKKWSTGGTKYVSLKEDENCVKMLKSFITAVENSNNGFVYDWDKDVDQLNGKKVGLVFGLEEYEDTEGKIKTATKLNQFRSIDKVNNVKIPKVRKINGEFVDYEDYKNTSNSDSTAVFESSIEISDDMLAF